MSKRSEADKAANNSPAPSSACAGSPPQTDPLLPAARFARARDGGSEPDATGTGGAPPSNTAPPNSNQHLPDGFQLLRVAVDSLYLSFPGELFPSVHARLSQLKTQAQSEHLEIQALAQYPLGSHVFEVRDKGARLYPFVLEDNAFRVQLSNPGKRLPMAYVKVSAHLLAHLGPEAALLELVGLLDELGELNGTNVVSRIDLAVDFLAPCTMDSWNRAAWVTRASRIDQHSAHQVFTGWSIGMGGEIGARLYDKTREIEFSGKTWAKALWRPHGWQEGQEVWRLEFEFKREFLKERGLSSLQSVMEHLNGLWSYATTEWLRLTLPSASDTTRTRWPTHSLWLALSSVDWEQTSPTRLKRFSSARAPDPKRLYSMMYGSLASYMAIHRLDDKHEAMEGLLGEMHQHYQDLAFQQGLDADEALLRRVRARARLFNTNDNTQAQEPEESEEARAYRRASDGE